MRLQNHTGRKLNRTGVMTPDKTGYQNKNKKNSRRQNPPKLTETAFLTWKCLALDRITPPLRQDETGSWLLWQSESALLRKNLFPIYVPHRVAGGFSPSHRKKKNKTKQVSVRAAKSKNALLKLRVYQWINMGQSRLRGPAAVVPSALCETEASSAMQRCVIVEDFCITRQTSFSVWLENKELFN